MCIMFGIKGLKPSAVKSKIPHQLSSDLRWVASLKPDGGDIEAEIQGNYSL